MKLTKDNYIDVLKIFNKFTEYDIGLVKSLLLDVDEYSDCVFPCKLELHINEYHTNYSAERTDPCPDYYGMFYIKWEFSDDIINDYFTLNELDDHMCTLCDSFYQLKNSQRI